MTCPICKRPTVAEWKPFCSRRCADVDLGRWLTGDYAIPVADAGDEDTSPAPGTDDDRPPRPS